MYKKYIAFDCETTGIHENCNLLTVTFIVLNSDLIEENRLNISLKQDGYYVYPEALQVNKINLILHHKESLYLIDARKKLHEFLIANKGTFNFIPIGHNIQFDIRFIKKSGLLTNEEYSKYISCNPIDTLVIAQFLKLSKKLHDKQSLSLISLCKSFGLQNNKELEHSSEYDIEMTIELLKLFRKLELSDTMDNGKNANAEVILNKKRKLI